VTENPRDSVAASITSYCDAGHREPINRRLALLFRTVGEKIGGFTNRASAQVLCQICNAASVAQFKPPITSSAQALASD